MRRIEKIYYVIAKTNSEEFTKGCPYRVEKVIAWLGLTKMRVYNDEGNIAWIEFPFDKVFGHFEKLI